MIGVIAPDRLNRSARLAARGPALIVKLRVLARWHRSVRSLAFASRAMRRSPWFRSLSAGGCATRCSPGGVRRLVALFGSDDGSMATVSPPPAAAMMNGARVIAGARRRHAAVLCAGPDRCQSRAAMAAGSGARPRVSRFLVPSRARSRSPTEARLLNTWRFFDERRQKFAPLLSFIAKSFSFSGHLSPH